MKIITKKEITRIFLPESDKYSRTALARQLRITRQLVSKYLVDGFPSNYQVRLEKIDENKILGNRKPYIKKVSVK